MLLSVSRAVLCPRPRFETELPEYEALFGPNYVIFRRCIINAFGRMSLDKQVPKSFSSAYWLFSVSKEVRI